MKKITHRKNLTFYLTLASILLGGLLYALFRPVSPQVAMVGNPDGGVTTVSSGTVCVQGVASFTTTGGCNTNMVQRVDTLCADGRKSFESSASCVDPIAAYQRAKIFCGSSCTNPVPTSIPVPSTLPGTSTPPTPVSSCVPRPACLDSTPACALPETSNMCPRPTYAPKPIPTPLPPTSVPAPSSTTAPTEPVPTPGCRVVQPFCWSRFLGAQCPAQIVCPQPAPVQSSTPVSSCRPRPTCLDATPACKLPITSDMCPPAPHVTPWPTVVPSPRICMSWNLFGWSLCNGSWQRTVTQ